jgi:hypothetical protein
MGDVSHFRKVYNLDRLTFCDLKCNLFSKTLDIRVCAYIAILKDNI